ncbi:MAG: hypothetical protein ACNS62_06965, partial [Candidatus Cyclobacteriaceae bacterium M3_2C_046]
MRKLLRYLLIISFLTYSCTALVPLIIEKKNRSAFEDTPQEKSTHQYFWNQLHQGHYDSLEKVLDRLHAAYAKDPRDFKLAAHLGFAYAWKVTERRRKQNLSPSIAAAGDLALNYFDEVVALNKHDPRLLGFKAGFMLANGSRHQDDRLRTKGYFVGKRAIRQWPSFNLFSIGYVMSGIEHDKDRYNEAVEFQWHNLEECLCRKINRDNPQLDDIGEIPQRVATDYKKSRACTNSWIAPHNVEGFLLNLGDMLVKQGNTAAAREVYNSIEQVKEYPEWPYKAELTKRL